MRVWFGGRGHGHALERLVFCGFDDGVGVSWSCFYVCIVLRGAWVLCFVPAVVVRVLCGGCALWRTFFRALRPRVGRRWVDVLGSAEDGCVVIGDGNGVCAGVSVGIRGGWDLAGVMTSGFFFRLVPGDLGRRLRVFLDVEVGCLVAVAITKWLVLGSVGGQFVDGLRGYHAGLLVEDESSLLATH
jgi:hypothetical protein